jgi:hypothetical protein
VPKAVPTVDLWLAGEKGDSHTFPKR